MDNPKPVHPAKEEWTSKCSLGLVVEGWTPSAVLVVLFAAVLLNSVHIAPPPAVSEPGLVSSPVSKNPDFRSWIQPRSLVTCRRVGKVRPPLQRRRLHPCPVTAGEVFDSGSP